jgi:transposase InsO family protein
MSGRRFSRWFGELRPVLAPLVVGGLLAVLTAMAWASWSYRRMDDAAVDARFAPPSVDPPAGPRAPGSDAFGARVGHTSLADAQALLRRLGVECPDTSARAIMTRARAARLREAEDRKARGLPPDAVSGASAGRRSPMERNPQVRLSCEGLPTTLLGDRPRAPSEGRLLLVFDSDELPVRHVSFQRTMTDTALARSELQAAVAAFETRFGPPTRRPPADQASLPWLVPVEYVWTFADLTVRASALNFGGTRGIMLTELIEVPLPVRADAPALQAAR